MDRLLENTLKKMDHDAIAATLVSQNQKRSKKDESKYDAVSTKKPKVQRHNNNEGMNAYSGWTVPSNKFTIPTISLQGMAQEDEKMNLTPQQFYNEYISARKPVVLRGWRSLSDLDKLRKWNNNEYLKHKAGEERIMVEKRSTSTDTFGQGNEVSMTFEEFLDLMACGDDLHYLTTQDVEANRDGRPDLMAPFMKTLKDDFPLRPKLMGNLVPQNINLWMGNNKNGASSGLHHDYHDNLYLVLRGKKRFRLFSPGDAAHLYCRGKLAKVHPNGRINYEGEITTAYGADLKSDAAAKAARAKDEAEQRLMEAETALKNGIKGAKEILEDAERMMEEAMDALIDAEMGESVSDEEDDGGDCSDFENEDEQNSGVLFGTVACTSKTSKGDIASGSDDDGKPKVPSINGNHVSEDEEERRLVDRTVKNPNNFSVVNHELLDNAEGLRNTYPNILKANSAFCDVNDGDILYLPASWFHEVTSFGDEDQNGHLALNFWFHPPDAANDFNHPYSTDFWPNDFKQRLDDNIMSQFQLREV